ncbi:hypothetical protein BKA64DRAFT_730305 [Cadophora sp. MPI-SDFR-AT-0126]|nr:hypothetical protein BKA64DRAFT_730305 [Leotiomycetes sp. MPI-SDFR-AT-0126]
MDVQIRICNHRLEQIKTQLYPLSHDSSSGSLSSTDTNAPRLIFLASWMNASSRHISKYTSHYQSLYPSTPILLVTSSTSDFFPFSTQHRLTTLAPAISTIRAYTDGKHVSRSGLLVHAMSNGGGGQLALLSKQYLTKTGRPLPANAIVHDSLPGTARFKQGLATFSLGLPATWYLRLPMQLMYSILLLFWYILPQILGQKILALVILNSIEPEFIRKEAKRCYIYSDGDEVVLDKDVEEHAKEAERNGLRIEKVKFEGTSHVGHMRSDPARYWEIVKRSWEGRA